MHPAPSPTSPARPARVLIADDTVQAAELLEAYLAETNYETRIAADGEQTLGLVESWHPDLILLDVMMPRISGFEVCKRLRSNPATRNMAVLMITALDQPSDIERAVEVGCDEFMSKPVQKSDFLQRVRALLASRNHERELDRALAYLEAVEQEQTRP
jgi:DNA-binding response OmpR family regulator